MSKIPKIVTTLMIALLWAVLSIPARAQDVQPFLKVVDVDVSQYPTTLVSLAGTGLPVAQQMVTISETVTEEEVTYAAPLSEPQVVGVRLAVVLDPQAMDQLSMDGARNRCAVLKDVMGQLVQEDSQNDILENSHDRMALYTFDVASQTAINIRDRTPEETWEWTVEPRSVTNNGVGRYCDLTETTAVTSDVLGPLLTAVLNKFVSPVDAPEGGDPRLSKEILLFSAGSSTFDPAGLVQTANQLGVYIHAVELPGQGFGGTNGLLQQLATQTQGQYVLLDSFDKLPALWERIRLDRQQRQATFVATATQVQALTVIATLPDGTQIADSTVNRGIDLPQKIGALGLQPPTLAILQPAAGESITWEPLIESVALQPETLPIKLSITPGAGNIGIKEVGYRLTGADGQTMEQMVSAAPFDETTLSITNPIPGEYVLTITATDLVGQAAAPLTAQLRFERKPTPTATPVPVATTLPAETTTGDEQPGATRTQNSVTTGMKLAEGQANAQGEAEMTWKHYSFIAILFAILAYLLFLFAAWLVKRLSSHKVEPGQTAADPLRDSAQRTVGGADRAASEWEKLPEEEEETATRRNRRAGTNKTWTAQPNTTGETTLEDEAEATQKSVPLQPRVVAELVRLDRAMSKGSQGNAYVDLPTNIEIPDVVNQIYLGRLPEKNQLVIRDGRISRQQVRFRKIKGQFYIEDVRESLGTYVNNVRLEKECPKLLHDGDQINFGEIAYEYRVQRETNVDEEREDEPTD